MSFTGVNVASINGVYKEIYGDLRNLLPDAGKVLKLFPYDKGNKLGDSFHEPVILTQEHGYSYGGTAGDAFDLEDPIGMATKDAVVGAYQYCMQSSISTTAASRAQSAGKQAFASAVATVVANAKESAGKRLQISVLYGQSGLGDVPDTSATVETTSTTATIVFSEATWAPGIWAGAEGAKLQFYDLDDDTLVSSSTDAVFTVTTVRNSTRTLVVTGTAAGIDALDIAVQAGGVRAYFKGSKTNDMLGAYSIFQNTGSMFSIDAASYGLWRGNTFNVNGALTHSKLQDYISELVGRGLDGDINVMVNPLIWGSLNNDVAALRSFDSSYSGAKAENGVEKIVYHGQNGLINIMSETIVKTSHAFVFQDDLVKRIGSAETDMDNNTGNNAAPFYPLASQAGFGFRVFSDQAVFTSRPAKCLILTGITQ